MLKAYVNRDCLLFLHRPDLNNHTKLLLIKHCLANSLGIFLASSYLFFNDLFNFMCIGVKVSDLVELYFSDSCELPCECWEVNPGPLEEQSVFLTTEPFLQPLYLI